MTTGELIKSKREALGISAQQLARNIGVTLDVIIKIENGDISLLTRIVRVKLVQELEIDPMELATAIQNDSTNNISTNI